MLQRFQIGNLKVFIFAYFGGILAHCFFSINYFLHIFTLLHRSLTKPQIYTVLYITLYKRKTLKFLRFTFFFLICC